MTESSTTILRRLLDERGVEWHISNEKGATFWTGQFGIGYYARQNDDGETLHMLGVDLTPKQAIAATLGSCNCSNNCTNSERTETCKMEYVSDWMSWHCKSCDHMDMAPRNPKPRYCKWCGRKVVDA